MELIYPAFVNICTLPNIMAILGGIAIGILVGAIPGLGPNMAMAVALPISFYLSPMVALGLLVGIYKGGIYGGSITAILINVPGTSDAAATMLDGYPLAKQGKAGKALKIAILASVTGDTLSDIVLILVAGWLATYAIALRAADLTAILLFSFVVIGNMSGESISKGLFACALGFFVAMIGIDPIMGVRRFTFGILELDRGIDLVPFMVGIFGITEVMVQLIKKPSIIKIETVQKAFEKSEGNRLSFKEYRNCLPQIMIGTGVGTIIGALPGIGATAAAYLSYGFAKKYSKNPEKYGHGEIKGVAAAEAGNNATCGATFIPLFTLGIPGSITAAIFGGALILQGITPGPFMFQQHKLTINTLYAGMIIANLFNLLLGYYGVKLFAKVALIPERIIYPIVVALCMLGTYSCSGAIFDILLMYIFGFIGFLMRKYNFPIAPMLISYILEPMFERSFRQALILSHNNYATFIQSPVSCVFFALSIGIIIFEIAKHFKSQRYLC